MARSSFAFAFLAGVVVAMALVSPRAMAVNHIVGGEQGWKIPPTPTLYQDWANGNGPFNFGDTLEFKNAVGDDVALVQGAGYNMCLTTNAFAIYPVGTSTVVSLRHGGRWFFISGIGNHCALGQKFWIQVA